MARIDRSTNFIVLTISLAHGYSEVPYPVVNVETISLAQRGVQLPSARVGIVIAQPHVVLSPTEPFHCTPESKVAQLANIAATLAVARDRPHGESKTHFTVFPEYSIPGSEGVALIQSTLADAAWPVGTIVIGGTDALTKPQFVALANEPGSHVHPNPNPVDRIADHEWVNCGIRGVSHEACIEHSKTFPPLPRRQVLLVSRDLDNNPWRVRFGSFLETQTAQLGEERKTTIAAKGVAQRCVSPSKTTT